MVVRGPSESLEVVAEVVKALDSRSAAGVDVKVFHLEYADADNTAELINEVFGADRSSSRSSSRDDMPMSFRRSPGGGGQTIVIGGLVEDQLIESVKKIPGLGDLPVIGHLFKRTTTEKAKKELLIFLTPLVAMADDELTAISEAEKNRNTLTQQGMGAELFDQHMEGMRGDVDPNER